MDQILESSSSHSPSHLQVQGLEQRILSFHVQGQVLTPHAAAAAAAAAAATTTTTTATPGWTGFKPSGHGWRNTGAEDSGSQRISLAQRSEEPGRSMKRQVLLRILSFAGALEVELSSLLSKDPVSTEDLEKITEHRTTLLSHYERVILADVEFSEEQDVSQILWKNAFHQVIERLAQVRLHPSPMKPEYIQHQILAVLEEGTGFFESLLRKLENRYRFQLAHHQEVGRLGRRSLEEPLKSALTCAQKFLICLGDLARYHEQTKSSKNFGKARSWYLQAQQLDPSDERPYSQLALLAVYTKRKLEAVCYFMRSLAADRPSVSSEKNLRKLLEASKYKAENRGKLSIHSSLGSGDLQQSFIHSFLQVHWRLFTGVEMETFPARADEMLQKFQLLLQRSPSAMGSQQMLNLMAINIFSAHNSSKKQASTESGSALTQREATALFMAMLKLLVSCYTNWLQQCPRILADCPAEEEEQEEKPGQILVSSFSPTLQSMLPSVKIGCQWMLFSRPPCSYSPGPLMPFTEVSGELWGTLVQLGQMLRMVGTSEVPLYKEPGDGLTLLILEEDQFFSGFGPLLDAIGEPCYLRTNSDKIIAGNCRRVSILKGLLEALFSQENPQLVCKEGKGQDMHTPTQDFSKKEEERQLQGWLEGHEEQEEFLGDLLLEGAGAVGSHLRELMARKLLLARKITEEQQYQEKIKDLLQAQTQPRQLTEGVPVSFLVLDTNSFILHLKSLSQLLRQGNLTLLVPHIVIHELKGLAKGQQGAVKIGAHAWETQQWAQKSLDFLHQQLQSGNPQLKVLSSQGKELKTVDWDRKCNFSQQGNNDDQILCCCLKFLRDQTKNILSAREEEQMQLQAYGLVLLTDDRALRVKAMASGVPVWDKETFLQEMKKLQLHCQRMPSPPSSPPPSTPSSPPGKQHQTQKRFRPDSGLGSFFL